MWDQGQRRLLAWAITGFGTTLFYALDPSSTIRSLAGLSSSTFSVKSLPREIW